MSIKKYKQKDLFSFVKMIIFLSLDLAEKYIFFGFFGQRILGNAGSYKRHINACRQRPEKVAEMVEKSTCANVKSAEYPTRHEWTPKILCELMIIMFYILFMQWMFRLVCKLTVHDFFFIFLTQTNEIANWSPLTYMIYIWLNLASFLQYE